MLKNVLIVFIGGGTGSVFRYLSSLATSKYSLTVFPAATFFVNMTGCLLIGAMTGLYMKHTVTNPDIRLLLVTGFCGGFTTFSAFAQENINLIQTNNITTAILYTALSVIGGIGSAGLGLYFTR